MRGRRNEAPAGMKWCNGSGHFAPLDAFARCANSFDGRQRMCRACKSWRMFVYFSTDKGQEARRASVGRWREKFPERAAANAAIARAIRKLELLPPTRCALAGVDGHRCDGNVAYHHWDYARPLDVTPLCRAAHDVADHTRDALAPELARLRAAAVAPALATA